MRVGASSAWVALLALAAGCGDAADKVAGAGQEGGACVHGRLCDVGLTCDLVDDQCVALASGMAGAPCNVLTSYDAACAG